jgi:hypothetical protein
MVWVSHEGLVYFDVTCSKGQGLTEITSVNLGAVLLPKGFSFDSNLAYWDGRL